MTTSFDGDGWIRLHRRTDGSTECVGVGQFRNYLGVEFLGRKKTFISLHFVQSGSSIHLLLLPSWALRLYLSGWHGQWQIVFGSGSGPCFKQKQKEGFCHNEKVEVSNHSKHKISSKTKTIPKLEFWTSWIFFKASAGKINPQNYYTIYYICFSYSTYCLVMLCKVKLSQNLTLS